MNYRTISLLPRLLSLVTAGSLVMPLVSVAHAGSRAMAKPTRTAAANVSGASAAKTKAKAKLDTRPSTSASADAAATATGGGLLSRRIGGVLLANAKVRRVRPVITKSETWISKDIIAAKPVIDPLTTVMTGLHAGDKVEFEAQVASAPLGLEEIAGGTQGLAVTAGRAVRFKTFHTIAKLPEDAASVDSEGSRPVLLSTDHEIEVPVHARIRARVNGKTTTKVVRATGQKTTIDGSIMTGGLVQRHDAPWVVTENIFASASYVGEGGRPTVDLLLLAAVPLGTKVRVTNQSVPDAATIEFLADGTGSGRVAVEATEGDKLMVEVMYEGEPGHALGLNREMTWKVAKGTAGKLRSLGKRAVTTRGGKPTRIGRSSFIMKASQAKSVTMSLDTATTFITEHFPDAGNDDIQVYELPVTGDLFVDVPYNERLREFLGYYPDVVASLARHKPQAKRQKDFWITEVKEMEYSESDMIKMNVGVIQELMKRTGSSPGSVSKADAQHIIDLAFARTTKLAASFREEVSITREDYFGISITSQWLTRADRTRIIRHLANNYEAAIALYMYPDLRPTPSASSK